MTPRETFVAAAHREPDLTEELDRADEAVEAEVDEEIPSPSQQRQLLRAHVNLGHPTIGEFCRALRNGHCRREISRWVKRYFKCPECEARPMPRTRPAALPKCCRLNQVCGIDTMEVRNPLNRENPIPNIARHLPWDTSPPGSTQAGHDSDRDLFHIATVLAQTLRCYGSFDHGSGYRIWCRISTPMPIQGRFFACGD